MSYALVASNFYSVGVLQAFSSFATVFSQLSFATQLLGFHLKCKYRWVSFSKAVGLKLCDVNLQSGK